jgi:diaminohydroxyphosphoribosylaminopyrimidine deaminase/5-amino-6-(5-phosphoribosylamino)uracil reductase
MSLFCIFFVLIAWNFCYGTPYPRGDFPGDFLYFNRLGVSKMIAEELMKRALDLARKGEGWTTPNPMVGAVIVNRGQVVGEGYHQKAGTPHAEIHALNMAGDRVKGGTIYVTLEPCCHFGRTPPCTDALIKAGIAKVVVAMTDPNPQVAGGGLKKLKEAGVEVMTGVLEEEARILNEVFIKHITARRPFVALKSALTLDGKTAAKNGTSQWITGEEAREYVHRLRHKYDAILVGIGTVLADDPLLTTRLPGLKNPLRVVLDSSLRIPLTARVLDTRTSPTLVFTAVSLEESAKARKIKEKGGEVISCPGAGSRVDIPEVLKVLYERGITGLLVEGGREVGGSFFDARLIENYLNLL